jgi:CheY-like chemotaxis protein
MALTRSDKKFAGKVLVVDDNWITLKLIEKMLSSFDLAPVTADSGAEALALLHKESFDLLFLDCTMPGLDGYAVAKSIRASEKGGARLRIIAFTADDTIENRRHCKEAGMDGLFPKPYSYTSLEELLGKFLKSTDEIAKVP